MSGSGSASPTAAGRDIIEGVQARDLVLVQVQAEHVVAGVREAGAGDETYVAGAENGYTHELSYPKGSPRAAQAQRLQGTRAAAQAMGFWPWLGLAASERRRLAAKSATFVAGACGDTALRVHT